MTPSGPPQPERRSRPERGGFGPRRDDRRAAEDLDLMQRVADRRAGSAEELYDRFSSLVYRMALQTMPSRAEAEDAVQEVFVRLWRTAAKFDPKKAALVTWVMLLTRRHLVDKLRRLQVIPRHVSLADGSGDSTRPDPSDRGELPSQPLEQREDFIKLMERVGSLPELQKTVVMRAYLGRQTLRQISEELSTPLGTIKSALSRALVRLRERGDGGSDGETVGPRTGGDGEL